MKTNFKIILVVLLVSVFSMLISEKVYSACLIKSLSKQPLTIHLGSNSFTILPQESKYISDQDYNNPNVQSFIQRGLLALISSTTSQSSNNSNSNVQSLPVVQTFQPPDIKLELSSNEVALGEPVEIHLLIKDPDSDIKRVLFTIKSLSSDYSQTMVDDQEVMDKTFDIFEKVILPSEGVYLINVEAEDGNTKQTKETKLSVVKK